MEYIKCLGKRSCGRLKPKSDFYLKPNGDLAQRPCKQCYSAYQAQRARDKRARQPPADLYPETMSYYRCNRDFYRWYYARNAAPAVQAEYTKQRDAEKRKSAPAGHRWCGYGQHYVLKDEWGGHPSYCRPCATAYQRRYQRNKK